MMISDYIEFGDGGYRVKGTRVSLDSVVYRFLEGLSPETIQSDCFPVLTLEQVYGAITYYLGHREEVDSYLSEADKEYDLFKERVRSEYSDAHRRIDTLREAAKTIR